MTGAAGRTAWEHGRFDARVGTGRVLFGRMYEDAAIERAAFPPGGRVMCIASAGCTTMALAPDHEVVAVDINPVQLGYAAHRLAGGRGAPGTAERLMDVGRLCAPLLGWTPPRLRTFLDLEDPAEQAEYWRRHLDTWRFRAAMDGLLSLTALRGVYAAQFLDFLPRNLGGVMRGRLARGFARHPNRHNPYARALLLGELPDAAVGTQAGSVRLVHADAADFLERQPRGSFDGFALSNILDGAAAGYGRRLFAAVAHAAAPEARMVLRSFREASRGHGANRAAEDRAMLWGIVDVRPVSELAEAPLPA
ncbi:MAG TPA: hypothetical protein VMB48_11345 [Steroidobacteraceae bacterium]|nr:hypothetical protein [Steroidobacteraceae bacterium]